MNLSPAQLAQFDDLGFRPAPEPMPIQRRGQGPP